MATDTLDQTPEAPDLTYRPNRTLGRSGYVPSAEDRFACRIEQLDALLCVLSTYTADETDGFDNFNHGIRSAVLGLASSLATEVHELHGQLTLQEAEARANL